MCRAFGRPAKSKAQQGVAVLPAEQRLFLKNIYKEELPKMKKKFVQRIFSVLLSVLLVLPVFTLIPVSAADNTVISSEGVAAGYDVSKLSVMPTGELPDIADYPVDDKTEYALTTPEGLVKLSELVNAGNDFTGLKIHMMNDIDMSGVSNFEPIGFDRPEAVASDTHQQSTVPTVYFAGFFDGHGFRIDNLTVDLSAIEDVGKIADVGLFGVLYTGAVVRNLILGAGCKFIVSNSTTPGRDQTYFGSVAGRVHCASYVTISNVYSKASIDVTYGVAGGIVGTFYSTKANANPIQYCTFAGEISNAQTMGGILGLLKNAHGPKILNCRNTGTLTTATVWEGQGAAGGMVGTVNGINTASTLYLNACINNGTTITTANAAGNSGMVGIIRGYTTVAFESYCYNYGTQTAMSTTTPVANWINLTSGNANAVNIKINGTWNSSVANYNNYITEGADPTFKQMLDTQVQLTEGTTATSESTNLRLITSIDTLNYKNVGFKVTLKAEDGTVGDASRVVTTVYNTIIGKGKTYTPYTEFDPTSRYFATMELQEIPTAYFGMRVEGYAYATDMDGNEIKGDSFSFVLSELFDEA